MTSGWSAPGGSVPQQPGPAPAPPPQGWDPAAVPAAWGGTGGYAQPAWQGHGAPAAPRPGVVPLRPLGLGELLDGSVRLVRGYAAPVLGASAVVAVVGTLLQVLLVLVLVGPVLSVDDSALEAGETEALLAVQAASAAQTGAAVLLAVVTGALLAGALSAAAGKAVLGQPFTVADLLAALRGKVLRLVGQAFLVVLLVALPFVLGVGLTVLAGVVTGGPGAFAGLLLVPAGIALSVLAYVRLALASSALVLEDAGVVAALRRSSALVKGDGWRVLGVLLLTVVVASLVSSVLQLPFLLFGGGSFLDQLVGAEAPGTSFLLLSSVGAGVGAFVVDPFVAGVTALLYVDRRMRAEGLDVALRASAERA